MRNVPRREPCPRPQAGGPAGSSRAVPGSATGRELPGTRQPTGGWEAVLPCEPEFLADVGRLLSALAQFEAGYP